MMMVSSAPLYDGGSTSCIESGKVMVGTLLFGRCTMPMLVVALCMSGPPGGAFGSRIVHR